MFQKCNIWKENLNNITSIKQLKSFLSEEQLQIVSNTNFPINIPRRIINKIDKNINDPLFLQFVSNIKEITDIGEISPLKEEEFMLSESIMKKYSKRALLLISNNCAMNCRYCFRRNSKINKFSDNNLEKIIIENNIEEIIFSGGDPLYLSNKFLLQIIKRIAPYIKRLRIHTRFPIGFPERIDREFLNILNTLPTYIVLQCNHSKELDKDVLKSLKMIVNNGTPLLTQSVFLKGVNDSVEALEELFTTLINNKIIPYYIHHLDKVNGGMHFLVEKEKSLKIMEEIQNKLPGYSIPKYVEELPYKKSKTPVIQI